MTVKAVVRGEKDVAIRPDDPRIVRYSRILAERPCRAHKVITNSWWVADSDNRANSGSLIFLSSTSGDIPQTSNDAMVINILKRKLFPWANIIFLPKVYLVKHQTEGWQVPYGKLK